MKLEMTEAEQPAGKWHYGKWVEPDSPVTGVISARDCSWLCELLFCEGIDLDFIEYEAQGGNPDEYEMYEPTLLIGFKENDEGLYEEDPDAEFSAIYRGSMNIIQIVKSPYATYGELCSPCFPGQASIDVPGEQLCYAPDPEMYDTEYNKIPETFRLDDHDQN